MANKPPYPPKKAMPGKPAKKTTPPGKKVPGKK